MAGRKPCHFLGGFQVETSANPNKSIPHTMPIDTTGLANMQHTVITDDPIMVMTEITAASRLSRWTIIRKIKAGTFPAPLRLSEGRIGWKKSEVEKWKNGLTTGVAQ